MKRKKLIDFLRPENPRTLEEREGLLAEFERSGKTRPEFAKGKGIHYTTFSGWVRRRKKKALVIVEPKMKKPTFAEALIPWSAARVENSEGMQIELGEGIKLRVNSREQIAWTAELIGLLGRSPQC